MSEKAAYLFHDILNLHEKEGLSWDVGPFLDLNMAAVCSDPADK